MTRPNDIRKFLERMMEETAKYDGTTGIEAAPLRELVRQNPDTSAGAVNKLLESTATKSESQRVFLQLAQAIAVVYEIEFDDDSLKLEVERAYLNAGIEARALRTINNNDEAQPTDPEILALTIDKNSLENADPYDIVRQFSIKTMSVAELSNVEKMIGRYIITFDLDHDSREVWQVPEVSGYIRNLLEALPYFPMYLNFDSNFGMFFVFFGSLADSEAWSGTRLHTSHPSLLGPILSSFGAVKGACKELGLDHLGVWSDIVAAAGITLDVLGDIVEPENLP